MIIEYYFKNFGFEFIYEKFESFWKSTLLIIGNKKWKSKKTYMIFNKKFYKNLESKHFHVRYLPFNIKYIGIDINHKNIPFMFNLFI